MTPVRCWSEKAFESPEIDIEKETDNVTTNSVKKYSCISEVVLLKVLLGHQR